VCKSSRGLAQAALSGAFIRKVSDAESEAAETQVRIEFAVKRSYLERDRGGALYLAYDDVLRTLVGMITHPETWGIGGESP
jgi:four helix bundle protein